MRAIARVAAFASAAAGVSLSGSANAQEPPAPPAQRPEGSGQQTNNGANPAVKFLQSRHRLSQAQAEERISLQADIQALLEGGTLTQAPGFVDLVVTHEPVYQVLLNFETNADRPELLSSIPARLRRYVKIRLAKHNGTRQAGGIQAINRALKGKIPEFGLYYSSTDQQFVVDVPTAETVEVARGLLPVALAQDVIVNVAPVPKAEASTTAVPQGALGSYVAGGYGVRTGTTSTGTLCTLGYPITFGTNLRGILTAGHCTLPKRITYSNGQTVTFPDAYYQISQNNYDYAIYRTDGLSTDYSFYYYNSQGIPEFRASGWLNLKNFIRRANQWEGMTACKSGWITGVTCGSVISLTFDQKATGGSQYVLVSRSAQANLSEGGDSGSPWFAFVDARTTSDVSGIGLHTAGDGTGSTARAVYMPIDRVFDHVPNVKLITTPW